MEGKARDLLSVDARKRNNYNVPFTNTLATTYYRHSITSYQIGVFFLFSVIAWGRRNYGRSVIHSFIRCIISISMGVILVISIIA